MSARRPDGQEEVEWMDLDGTPLVGPTSSRSSNRLPPGGYQIIKDENNDPVDIKRVPRQGRPDEPEIYVFRLSQRAHVNEIFAKAAGWLYSWSLTLMFLIMAFGWSANLSVQYFFFWQPLVYLFVSTRPLYQVYPSGEIFCENQNQPYEPGMPVVARFLGTIMDYCTTYVDRVTPWLVLRALFSLALFVADGGFVIYAIVIIAQCNDGVDSCNNTFLPNTWTAIGALALCAIAAIMTYTDIKYLIRLLIDAPLPHTPGKKAPVRGKNVLI